MPGVSSSTKALVGLDDSIINLLKDKRLLISPDDLILGKCIGQGIYTYISNQCISNYYNVMMPINFSRLTKTCQQLCFKLRRAKSFFYWNFTSLALCQQCTLLKPSCTSEIK
jgi:hypothetical protein